MTHFVGHSSTNVQPDSTERGRVRGSRPAELAKGCGTDGEQDAPTQLSATREDKILRRDRCKAKMALASIYVLSSPKIISFSLSLILSASAQKHVFEGACPQMKKKLHERYMESGAASECVPVGREKRFASRCGSRERSTSVSLSAFRPTQAPTTLPTSERAFAKTALAQFQTASPRLNENKF